MINKAHRVCHKLHTVVKRTVSFDIDMLTVAVRIGYFKQSICVVTVLSSSVYLKLNSEESIGITVEDRLRPEAVVVDTTVSVNFLMIAFSAIILPIEMIRIILVKQSIAAAASGVMVFVTVTAKGGILIAIAVIEPNGISTSVAGSGMPLITIRADYLTMDLFVIFVFRNKCSAVGAVQCICVLVFFHFLNLRKY